MMLGKKLKVFIGTVGMKRGKKFIVFMVQLARRVKLLWVIVIMWYSSERA